jgi:hypothetical protein
MLLVIGAQAAVVRAAVLDGGCISEWDCPRLIDLSGRSVCLGIRVKQRFKKTMLRTAFPHKYFILPQENLGIDHAAAHWADAASKFIENIIGIPLCTDFGFHALIGHGRFVPSGEIGTLGLPWLEQLPDVLMAVFLTIMGFVANIL